MTDCRVRKLWLTFSESNFVYAWLIALINSILSGLASFRKDCTELNNYRYRILKSWELGGCLLSSCSNRQLFLLEYLWIVASNVLLSIIMQHHNSWHLSFRKFCSVSRKNFRYKKFRYTSLDTEISLSSVVPSDEFLDERFATTDSMNGHRPIFSWKNESGCTLWRGCSRLHNQT